MAIVSEGGNAGLRATKTMFGYIQLFLAKRKCGRGQSKSESRQNMHEANQKNINERTNTDGYKQKRTKMDEQWTKMDEQQAKMDERKIK